MAACSSRALEDCDASIWKPGLRTLLAQPGGAFLGPDGRHVLLLDTAENVQEPVGMASGRPARTARLAAVVTRRPGDLDGVDPSGQARGDRQPGWDRAGRSRTGEEPHLLIGHQAPIWGVRVDPTGRLVGSTSGDGTVRIWPMPEGQPLHTWPRDALLDKRSLTNVRIVPDASARPAIARRSCRFRVGPRAADLVTCGARSEPSPRVSSSSSRADPVINRRDPRFGRSRSRVIDFARRRCTLVALAVAIVVFPDPATAAAQAGGCGKGSSCTRSHTLSKAWTSRTSSRTETLGHKDRWARQLSDFEMGRPETTAPTTLKEFLDFAAGAGVGRPWRRPIGGLIYAGATR